jgi:hypothetical protein
MVKNCLKLQHFNACVAAVRELTGFDENSESYKTPSLALKVGHSLKNCQKS